MEQGEPEMEGRASGREAAPAVTPGLQVLRVALADIALIAHTLDPMLVHDWYRQMVAPQAYRTS